MEKDRRAEETIVVKELMDLCSKLNWSEEEKERINNPQ